MATLVLVASFPLSTLLAQSTPLAQTKFPSQNITGSLQALTTINVREVAKTAAEPFSTSGREMKPVEPHALRPPVRNSGPVLDRVAPTPLAADAAAVAPAIFRGFNGLTHLDTRSARRGNQFSTEPPDQALAVGNGFVLEAVNSALNVYKTNGVQQLARPLALSEFFGLRAAIDRTTGAIGTSPGDVSALYDSDTGRWFVVAFAQLNNFQGGSLPQTRVFVAVSQTSDPTGIFSIYTLITTGAKDPDGAGPRLPDFPHIGLDRYGLFISTNDFAIDPKTAEPGNFISAAITAISKKALITGIGGAAPPIVRFRLPFSAGYEFTVFPANTPPGTTPFLNNGGVEFFVSSRFINTTEHSLAVWALTNTSSLDQAVPALDLKAVAVETQAYHFPTKAAEQRKGFHPLGASLDPPEPVEMLDPGDFRVVSVVYTGGRIWATLGSEMTDAAGVRRHAADYFAFAPNVLGQFFNATLSTQGVVSRAGANLLYPAIAINAQQKGGMVFTLVGPNDYPSSAFVPFKGNTAGPIQISRAGNEPEDGFSGYKAFGGGGVARWGDYSAAAVDSDGSIWMATEYTPDLARTTFANWSTYITRYQP